MVNIQIIGAGQLGSRHLQALSAVNEALSITVVDAAVESLARAKSRFEEKPPVEHHQIRYQTEMPANEKVDIAIVASGAKPRREILEQLLSNNSVKYFILEKILFSNQEDYTKVSNLLAKKGSKAWVNCCMRMMPAYEKLQPIFNQKVIQYSVTGSQYGLITNAIHYLDHVAWLTGCKEFTLNTDFLDAQVLESKRPGYLELSGMLIAKYRNGSIAKLHLSNFGNAPVQIDIMSDENRFISREWEGLAWQTSANQNWKWEQLEAKIPFQSEMTSQLVKNLMNTGNCSLTPFEESVEIHLQLLEPLKHFLKKNKVDAEVDYPFT